MRPSLRLAVAGIAIAAMAVGVAVPAGAQETLGFEIDKTEGSPGDIVNGQVDTDDVAEHCTTDLEEFQARFQEVLDVIGAIEPGSFPERFFDDIDNPVVETHEQLAFFLVGFTIIGIAADLGGAAEDALLQTFVMTFADIATQQPVGELGNFDPDTGEGSVVVPDIEPGFWAVAAACVGPILEDLDAIEAGIRSSGPFLEELGVQFGPDGIFSPEFQEFIQDFTGETDFFDALIAFLGEIGPTLLAPLMVPDAFGAQIFCILDADGECPSDEVPPVPDEAPEPARPVVVQPAFTG